MQMDIGRRWNLGWEIRNVEIVNNFVDKIK